MNQCETCKYRDIKPFLTRCDANELGYHWREFWRSFPFIGRFIAEYKCKAYEEAGAL